MKMPKIEYEITHHPRGAIIVKYSFDFTTDKQPRLNFPETATIEEIEYTLRERYEKLQELAVTGKIPKQKKSLTW